MWVGRRENSQEATPSSVGIRYHLQEHLVAHGNQGSWLERPTEATKSLPVDMAAVDIHIVITAQVVVLQVNKAERQDHNLSLGHLGGNLQKVSLSHKSCKYVIILTHKVVYTSQQYCIYYFNNVTQLFPHKMRFAKPVTLCAVPAPPWSSLFQSTLV